MVSYRGVHVEVPDAWPVVDGMHAGGCGSVFPANPEVLVGPDENPPPDCPAPITAPPARAGVWLAPGTAPPGAHQVRTGRHMTVREARPGQVPHLVQVWYRHVAILIGIGTSQQVARRILASIGYTSGQPDTPDTGDCARASGPVRMPPPARLTARLVLDQGDFTVTPPPRSARPVMPAAAAWRQAGITSPFERYRLLLVRYSATFPARPGPGGTYRPVDHNVLAWVIYARPRTPIAGCGAWGLDSFNALTSQAISSNTWSGP